MVARMLFVSQLTLSHSIFGTPSAKMSIYAKLGRTIKQEWLQPFVIQILEIRENMAVITV